MVIFYSPFILHIFNAYYLRTLKYKKQEAEKIDMFNASVKSLWEKMSNKRDFIVAFPLRLHQDIVQQKTFLCVFYHSVLWIQIRIMTEKTDPDPGSIKGSQNKGD